VLRSRDALLVPGHAASGSTRTPAVICAPIVREQRIRGILLLESEHTSFRPGDLSLARAVARRLLEPLQAVLESTTRDGRVRDPLVSTTAHGYGNLIARSRSMQ